MRPDDKKRHAQFWEASDYKMSPRPIRALNLHLTTYCNLQCTECSSNNPRIRYPEHYEVDYIKHAARYLNDLEQITITGGEPTLNPQFRDIVPNLKNWFGCQNLALETNGAKIIENEDLLSYFDDVLISHYPDNSDAVTFLAQKNKDSRPDGPTIHVTKARRARNPAPCRRANFVQYVYGRLYPCTYTPDGCEDIGIPLTKNWREEIQNVQLPCANCCFANEQPGNDPVDAPKSLTGAKAVRPLDLNDFDQEALTNVRPAWRFPPRPEDLKIYGLDLDSWMGEMAEIVIDPAKSMDQMMIMFESHLPKERYPLTLTFENQHGAEIDSHKINNPGVTGVKLKLPAFMARPSDTKLRVRCDCVFAESVDGQPGSLSRNLGVRIRSARYVTTPRKGEKAPLYDDQLKLLNQFSKEISEKEAHIQKLEEKLNAQGFGLRKLRRTFIRDSASKSSHRGRKKSPQHWPKTALWLLKSSTLRGAIWLQRKVLPRAGDLFQYAPRPLKIPAHYHQRLTGSGTPPSISMVTPSLNQASFLERTIQSVLSQNYPDLEYSVQDGGSTDGSKDILEKYRPNLTAAQSSRDEGQAHAINLGFAKSRGEIMGWLNSDDLLLPGTLNYVGDYFARHPEVDALYGHRVLIDEDDLEIGRWVLPPHDQKILQWADYVPQETLFWRRTLWDKTGGQLDQGLQFALDWDLLQRFQTVNVNIVRVPRFLGAFRLHAAQKTLALVDELGYAEMDALREKAVGRRVSREEIHRNTIPYLLRSMAYQAMYRMRLKRY